MVQWWKVLLFACSLKNWQLRVRSGRHSAGCSDVHFTASRSLPRRIFATVEDFNSAEAVEAQQRYDSVAHICNKVWITSSGSWHVRWRTHGSVLVNWMLKDVLRMIKRLTVISGLFHKSFELISMMEFYASDSPVDADNETVQTESRAKPCAICNVYEWLINRSFFRKHHFTNMVSEFVEISVHFSHSLALTFERLQPIKIEWFHILCSRASHQDLWDITVVLCICQV